MKPGKKSVLAVRFKARRFGERVNGEITEHKGRIVMENIGGKAWTHAGKEAILRMDVGQLQLLDKEEKPVIGLTHVGDVTIGVKMKRIPFAESRADFKERMKEALFSPLNKKIKELKATGYEDRIPGEIAGVFDYWLKTLCYLFPACAWREPRFQRRYLRYLKKLFNKFWMEFEDECSHWLMRSIGIKLSETEKQKLKEKLKNNSFNAYILVDENLKSKPSSQKENSWSAILIAALLMPIGLPFAVLSALVQELFLLPFSKEAITRWHNNHKGWDLLPDLS